MSTYKAKLGSFGKAINGSVSANFGQSAGANCSRKCRYYGRGCYAVGIERRKPSVSKSGLYREQQGFLVTCMQLASDLRQRVERGDEIPWFRFSSFGSVPNRPLTGPEEIAFVSLCKAIPKGTPVHFPVESGEKASRYRTLFARHGINIVVRESIQSRRSLPKGFARGQVSIGGGQVGKPLRENLKSSRALARKLGSSSRVCPAIAATAMRRNPVKCGQCNFCARPDIKTIIYPIHS